MEQEGWHGAIVMLLSENHSADQSAFLDLCVSPSASILLFFLLFLLFSTHSNFYSNFFQNQIGRSYSCSQNCFRLHFSICHFSICAAQCKANDMGMQNAQQNALRPFFTSLEPQFVAMVEVMTKRQGFEDSAVESVIKRQALQKLARGKTLLLKSCELRELILIDQSFARTFSFCRDSSSLHRCNTLVKASEGMSVPGMC